MSRISRHHPKCWRYRSEQDKFLEFRVYILVSKVGDEEDNIQITITFQRVITEINKAAKQNGLGKKVHAGS